MNPKIYYWDIAIKNSRKIGLLSATHTRRSTLCRILHLLWRRRPAIKHCLETTVPDSSYRRLLRYDLCLHPTTRISTLVDIARQGTRVANCMGTARDRCCRERKGGGRRRRTTPKSNSCKRYTQCILEEGLEANLTGCFLDDDATAERYWRCALRKFHFSCPSVCFQTDAL